MARTFRYGSNARCFRALRVAELAAPVRRYVRNGRVGSRGPRVDTGARPGGGEAALLWTVWRHRRIRFGIEGPSGTLGLYRRNRPGGADPSATIQLHPSAIFDLSRGGQGLRGYSGSL